jgi:hypothetical protein
MNITTIIPVAPMPSMPSTEVLDETIASVRERLPETEIILMFDGIPSWRTEMKPQYEQFTQRMLWRAEHEIGNVTPIIFDTHHHQNLMLKAALELVRTPLILWSEQDTPLTGEIPWSPISDVILTGYANLVRFHHEAQVHPEHQYLMLDESAIDVLGVPLIRCRQWSGRPHLASTKFYKEIAQKYFGDKPMFVEHILYGIVVDGDYDEFRLHLYAPEGTQVRSLHLDGRRKGAGTYDPNPS